MVLFPVLEVSTFHFYEKSNRCFCRTRTTIMNSFSFRVKNNPPSGLMKAPTPVEILTIHKKALVQETHAVNRFPPNHPEPSIQYINVLYSIVPKIITQEPAEDLRSLEHRI